ncbi:MAG: SpoIID/LytB domain-containing protein [Candidatus Delongbacteria bacterium]|nr:SpoIID/LytB domain-containing protein [Candidatus Delongbacteria bacterium]
MNEPIILVGVLNKADSIDIELFGAYKLEGYDKLIVNQKAQITMEPDQSLTIKPAEDSVISGLSRIVLEPTSIDQNCIEIKEVIIGIQFHWERKENQVFQGGIEFVPLEGRLQVINRIPTERYLSSVISSEMNPDCHIELLKAHAIISRSWLLANINKSQKKYKPQNTMRINDHEIYRWYDREDHTIFDVCADDHCQRYQGISKIDNPLALKAVQETAGEVLWYNNEICDARFHKSCGGITEAYQYVWDDTITPYLVSVVDDANPPAGHSLPMTQESEFEKWIMNNPPAFCNTHDQKILSKVLPDFDQETVNFYRWRVEYTRSELETLIQTKTGIDIGHLKDIIPLKRGESGRLYQIKLVGTKQELIIGKELEIRKVLSYSHLYSSAFVVFKHNPDENGLPERFELFGAGWGHGVGLCQIGAAIMAEKGYSYRQILSHYFRDSELKKIY